jgi:hypothetical protein
MPGPWDKYAQSDDSSSKTNEGPWDKYAQSDDSSSKTNEGPWRKFAQDQAKHDESWLDYRLPFDTTPRGIIQGGLNALPTAGMVAGGAAGSVAEPGFGTLGGAALGDAGGEALKNLGEKYILGQEKTRSDIYGKPAKGLVEGVAAEMGGQGLGAISQSPIVQNEALQRAAGAGLGYLGGHVGGALLGERLAPEALKAAGKALKPIANNPQAEALVAREILKSYPGLVGQAK